ncbi:MAG: PIN domain-containing protein [Muricauda sp.]|nr:PIN domain-containing protein [Allomuricauda sp.]MBO6533012.1 PIN domain-containing protein [Allomuricauda sp.]MBO6590214.1 PIN domain-containing protein [Allomuricauda sp.]MBO6619840.1 PIN domain-containing protein [Allomuricauda sp.]MBO6645818.1 PIN domain-containing protein [Allomuricauda sp.]MBO6748178.1 PIN domain-containing protein [Allomuricauda sp.]
MSRRIFVDTNVMLDLLGEREPFYAPIAKIATLAERKKLTMVVSPISFATVNYFLSKYESPKIAKEKLRKFKILCEICSMDEQTVEKGLNTPIKDFEDALQYFSATESGCEIIITRNGKDFKHSLLPVMTASEFLKSLRDT